MPIFRWGTTNIKIMRTLSILTFLTFLTTNLAIAQVEGGADVKNRMDDAFNELNTGELTLRFVNALTGGFVSGAEVAINGVASTTDFEGRVSFKPELSNYSVPVVFKKNGFITAEFTLEIMAGTIFQNQISVSPDLKPESLRIVLDWGDRPRDLDAHLIKKDGYHISYRDKRTADDGTAQLDRDDRNGNGPETITINRLGRGDTYTYQVHNYSNRGDQRSTDLSNRSHATVRVYGNSRLMAEYQIPANQTGLTWVVFQIQNGLVVAVNSIK
jgi:hypothetical protein